MFCIYVSIHTRNNIRLSININNITIVIIFISILMLMLILILSFILIPIVVAIFTILPLFPHDCCCYSLSHCCFISATPATAVEVIK